MFEPIVNKRIDLEGLEFEILLEDVEKLNKAAFQHIPDITKLSFNAFTKLYQQYQLLTAGSALGKNCGPVLISNKPFTPKQVKNLKIAVPGLNTTAYLLFKLAFPEADRIEEVIFSDIEQQILSGKYDAGLVIHESRFTYSSKGLTKIIDLGEYWEQKTKSPIPLGGIVIKRSIPEEIKNKVNRIITNSIQYAFEHPKSGLEYIKEHAREMDENVMFSHIDLYVNEFSRKLGIEGKKAVKRLFSEINVKMSEEELKDLFVE